MKNTLLKHYLRLGISSKDEPTEAKKTRLVNLFTLIGIGISVLFLALNIIQFPGDLSKHSSLIGSIALMLIISGFNHFRLLLVARIMLLMFITSLFFYNANYAYRGFYSEYFFLLLPLLSLVFFEKLITHITALLFAVALFYLPNLYYQVYEPQSFGYANVAFLFAGVFALVNYFKRLNQRNEKLLAEQKDRELALIQSRSLRAQLDSHFISNAMITIQNYVMDNDKMAASQYLTTFSRLMRALLETSRSEQITVSEEAALLSDYLVLSKARFHNIFDYQISISEELEPELDEIPAMFIQPFVENAIEHGRYSTSNPGMIEISFELEKDCIIVLVKDNGGGIDKGKKTDPTAKKSLSMSIIGERIDILNRMRKNKIALQVDNLVDDNEMTTGTLVKLIIPVTA